MIRVSFVPMDKFGHKQRTYRCLLKYISKSTKYYILQKTLNPTLFFQGSIVALAGTKIYCSKLYFCENLKTCIAVTLYAGFIMTKAKEP
jgi:hypothetical protein